MEITTPTMSTKQIRSKQQIRSSSRHSSSKRWVGPSPDRRHQPPTVSTRRHRRHPTRMGSSIRARTCSTGMASRMVSQMPSTTTNTSSSIMRAVTVAFRLPGLCPRTDTLDTLATRSWPQVQQQQRPTRTIRSYEYPRRDDGNNTQTPPPPRGRSVVATVAAAAAVVSAKILGTDANFSEAHVTLRCWSELLYVNFKSRRISLKKKNTIRVIQFLADGGRGGGEWRGRSV